MRFTPLIYIYIYIYIYYIHILYIFLNFIGYAIFKTYPYVSLTYYKLTLFLINIKLPTFLHG